MSSIIGPFQSAFLPSRLITDNALIAFEIFHYIRKKKARNTGFVGLKLDMAKAYDRVKWSFLEHALHRISFPLHWMELIMKCVSLASFSVLLNGIPCDTFKLERGLRQEDPLSPYLFILYAKLFLGLILRAWEEQALHRIDIARSAPEISHLFFADDSILFF